MQSGFYFETTKDFMSKFFPPTPIWNSKSEIPRPTTVWMYKKPVILIMLDFNYLSLNWRMIAGFLVAISSIKSWMSSPTTNMVFLQLMPPYPPWKPNMRLEITMFFYPCLNPVDGRNPKQPPGMYKNLEDKWDKLPILNWWSQDFRTINSRRYIFIPARGFSIVMGKESCPLQQR